METAGPLQWYDLVSSVSVQFWKENLHTVTFFRCSMSTEMFLRWVVTRRGFTTIITYHQVGQCSVAHQQARNYGMGPVDQRDDHQHYPNQYGYWYELVVVVVVDENHKHLQIHQAGKWLKINWIVMSALNQLCYDSSIWVIKWY